MTLSLRPPTRAALAELPLLVASSCDDCGACCKTVGGSVPFWRQPDEPGREFDDALLESLPDEARRLREQGSESGDDACSPDLALSLVRLEAERMSTVSTRIAVVPDVAPRRGD